MEHQQPQSKNKSTTFQAIAQHQENMDLCSCGSEEKVMFQCAEQACPSFQIQQLYCHECTTPEKHPHVPIFIAKKSKNVTDEWNTLRQDARNFAQRTQTWFDKHGTLIELLDRFLPNPEMSLFCKSLQLQQLSLEIDAFYDQHVNESAAKGDVLRLQQFEGDLKRFKERVKGLEGLRVIDKGVLWETYKDVVENVGMQEAVERLEKENLEIFTMLKLKGIRLSLDQIYDRHEVNEDDNPPISITLAEMRLHLKEASQQGDLSLFDAVKLASIRSDLDAVSMSLLLTSLQQQHNNLKREVEQQGLALRERSEQLEEMLEGKIEELKREMKVMKEEGERRFQYLNGRCIIKHSLILGDNDKMQHKIMGFFEQAGVPLKYPILLYRGSSDTFHSSAFHALCDNMPSTLTLVKSKCGHIVGGFTTQTWNHSEAPKADASAFLFNIQAPHIFRVKQGGAAKAVSARDSRGPSFGAGAYDLYIENNCNTGVTSCVRGASYEYNGSGNLFLREGEVRFSVAEVEVYKV
ncbi:hypothetical protein FGO68_gene5288 [Halteria grandinella]|uniref:TLDc domain-containing protein n=1 Tax=Halteria grandinella TaxID=5974 RepID=A0A8J8T3B2_HALGN|nr:hypothetical protein FGO68_gene5288 [Halteria grandinella]